MNNNISLENAISSIEHDIDLMQEQLNKNREYLSSLRKCHQPTNEELYKNISSFFIIENKKGQYEKILGGDGRSSPWSKDVYGEISVVKINGNIYLDYEQKQIIKEYVQRIHNPDHIKIIGF